MPANPTHAWEPSLPEMLTDPIVRALMSSDGVMAMELEELVHSATSRLGGRAAVATACCGRCRREPDHDREPGR